jgi:predicted PurR-regulated permease PerM
MLNAAISLFTLFFVFREGRTLRRRLATLLPLTDEQVHKLFDGIENTIVGTVLRRPRGGRGPGGAGGAGLLVARHRVARLVGCCGRLLLPLAHRGNRRGVGPRRALLLATGSWGKALMLVGWCLLVVAVVDNVLRPRLLSGRGQMHTLLIFFAVFGGDSTCGFLGLIIGPVIVAVTATLLGLLRDEARTWSSAVGDP